MYSIFPMTRECACVITKWRYAGVYAVYSFTPDSETLDELMSGQYYCAEDARGALAGYFCYGQAARIPTACADDYAGAYTDIGLGLAPELCGRGLGAAIMRAGIEYAHTHLDARDLRLTVA